MQFLPVMLTPETLPLIAATVSAALLTELAVLVSALTAFESVLVVLWLVVPLQAPLVQAFCVQVPPVQTDEFAQEPL